MEELRTGVRFCDSLGFKKILNVKKALEMLFSPKVVITIQYI
jgi:hypothetical protein